MKKFKFGDKVIFSKSKRQAIFIQDISYRYDFKSKMAEIIFHTGDCTKCRIDSLTKGWKKRGGKK